MGSTRFLSFVVFSELNGEKKKTPERFIHAGVLQAGRHQETSELWRRMDDPERLQERQLEELAMVPAELTPTGQQDL